MTGLGLRGRRLARLMLAIAIGLDSFVVLLFLNWPHTSGPMYAEPPDRLVMWLIPAVGVVVNVIGLAWMIRIYRSDPEAHPSFWRFRRS